MSVSATSLARVKLKVIPTVSAGKAGPGTPNSNSSLFSTPADVIRRAKDGTWTQDVAGAMVRTVEQKLHDDLSVRDFARADGAAVGSGGDDYLAFQRAASSGAHISVAAGSYFISEAVYSDSDTSWELDGGVTFTGTGGPGGGPILPDVLQQLSRGTGRAVKSFARYATDPYSDSVILIAQVQGYTPGAGPGLAGQQQAGLIRQFTANSNDATRGLVGWEVQQEFGPGEIVGAMWAYHALNIIHYGQMPYLCLAELQVVDNSGNYQRKVGYTDSKLGLHLNNLGDTISTVAISFGDAGSGAGWDNGIFFIPGAIRRLAYGILDINHDVVAGMDMSGKVNAQRFSIGTLNFDSMDDFDLDVVTVDLLTGTDRVFAQAGSGGGIRLDCTEFYVSGGRVDDDWFPYSPTCSTPAGSISTKTTDGTYKFLGSWVKGRAVLNVPNGGQGDGSGAVYLGVPVACKTDTAVCVTEVATGRSLSGYIQAGQSAIIVKQEGNYPINPSIDTKIIADYLYEAA